MQKIVIILLFSTILFAGADEYCMEYKEEAQHYYFKAQKNDYLYERYMDLYNKFNDKYNECLKEFKQGNYYQGYKKR